MSTVINTQPATDLISQMRSATMPAHELLDNLIMKTDPFASRENYGGLLTMQYCLQRDLDPLYHDASLKELLPDLESRSRLHLVEKDMADLGLTPPSDGDVFTLPLSDLPAKVGWVFVLEGSRLGAASLFRRAAALGLNETFGARHLAGPPDGPAGAWRTFVQAISALPFSEEEREHATAGAIAAFEHATRLTQRYIGGDKKEPGRA